MKAPISRALLLGDATILLIFTLGGMAFHHIEGQPVTHAVRIGLPFFLGYFLIAAVIDAFRPSPSSASFWRRSVAAWLFGISFALTLRVAVEGRAPVGLFVPVTFAFTGVLTLGWRAVYWWVRGRQPAASAVAR